MSGTYRSFEISEACILLPFYSPDFKDTQVCMFQMFLLLVDTSIPEVKELAKKKSGKARWVGISNLCSKIKVCGSHTSNGCGCVQPDKYSKEGLNKIYAHVDGKGGETDSEQKIVSMNAEMIHKIFSRISDEDCDLMGYSRHWCRPIG